MPAVSRLQKVHNVDLALATLKLSKAGKVKGQLELNMLQLLSHGLNYDEFDILPD